MGRRFRWGILGVGRIARRYAEGLQVIPEADLVAVGSRDIARANVLGDEFGISNRHGSYEALAKDSEVDIVYVATPHSFHRENVILALKAGKTVLCEKPLTVNASEAREVVAVARREDRFLMEAMKTRFCPAVKQAKAWLESGDIGELRMFKGSFGFVEPWDPKTRAFNPELAGGSLLDVGVYPISLASMLFGAQPRRIAGIAHIGETGVDEQAAMVFGYDKGAMAVISSATRAKTPGNAYLIGTEGIITLHEPFWRATQVTLSTPGKEDVSLEYPLRSAGFGVEAIEVMDCLEKQLTESPLMPLDESIGVMETMDELRRQWDLVYPMEQS